MHFSMGLSKRLCPMTSSQAHPRLFFLHLTNAFVRCPTLDSNISNCAELRPLVLGIVGMDEIKRILTKQLGWCVARDALYGRGMVEHPGVTIKH